MIVDMSIFLWWLITVVMGFAVGWASRAWVNDKEMKSLISLTDELLKKMVGEVTGDGVQVDGQASAGAGYKAAGGEPEGKRHTGGNDPEKEAHPEQFDWPPKKAIPTGRNAVDSDSDPGAD